MLDDAQEALPFWAEYWRAPYATARAWAHKGENLVHAFEVLADVAEAHRDLADLRDQALMLAGMGVEVLLKAIAVNVPERRAIVSARRPRANDDALALWEAFYSHDLVALATSADVPLTQSHTDTATGLSQYILWNDRYVVPRDSSLNSSGTTSPGNGAENCHCPLAPSRQ